MKKTIFLLLVLVNGMVFASHKSAVEGNLYVLIVADTSASGVGRSVRVDVDNVEKSFATIGKGIGFNMHTVVLSRTECSVQNVWHELRKLKTSPKDIVVFYYAGHGFNELALDTCWPVLCTHKGNTIGRDVIEYLKGKKKRLAVILFDCCNSYPETWERFLDLRGVPKPFFLKNTYDLKGFYNLLLAFKGTVSSSACAEGEDATCERSLGGTFTRAFLKSIYDLGPDETVSWDRILSLTVYKTAKISKEHFGYEQHPIYNIQNG